MQGRRTRATRLLRGVPCLAVSVGGVYHHDMSPKGRWTMGRNVAPACARWVTVVLAALIFSSQAMAQVYKCTQPGGRVLYSDEACKGGAVVDVGAGSTNPVAVRQLARDSAAFDRKMAARRAAEDQAEIRRQALNAQLEMARAAQDTSVTTNAGPYYYAPANAFVASRVKRRTHGHHAAPVPERRVPASPPPPRGLLRRSP